MTVAACTLCLWYAHTKASFSSPAAPVFPGSRPAQACLGSGPPWRSPRPRPASAAAPLHDGGLERAVGREARVGERLVGHRRCHVPQLQPLRAPRFVTFRKLPRYTGAITTHYTAWTLVQGKLPFVHEPHEQQTGGNAPARDGNGACQLDAGAVTSPA